MNLKDDVIVGLTSAVQASEIKDFEQEIFISKLGGYPVHLSSLANSTIRLDMAQIRRYSLPNLLIMYEKYEILLPGNRTNSSEP